MGFLCYLIVMSTPGGFLCAGLVLFLTLNEQAPLTLSNKNKWTKEEQLLYINNHYHLNFEFWSFMSEPSPVNLPITLLHRRFITNNILRMTFESLALTLHQQEFMPGTAYLFTIMASDSENITGAGTRRWYTIRKAWREQDDQGGEKMYLWVDLYVHTCCLTQIGNGRHFTAGAEWALRMPCHQGFCPQRRYLEKLSHLHSGHVYLIADETSMPTVARLLELWENPVAPVIISTTQAPSEQTYLLNNLHKAAKINPILNQCHLIPIIWRHKHHLMCGKDFSAYQAEVIFRQFAQQILEQSLIKVWGALEYSVIKHLEKLFSHFNPDLNHIMLKVYWKKQPAPEAH